MLDALRRWRDEIGDATLLGAVRVALGALLFAQALRSAGELSGGYFGDVFHWPLLPEACVPSRSVYTLLLAIEGTLAALVVTGWLARPALLASGALVLYITACDRLQFHNNRVALAYYAILLSLAPCDRSFVLGRRAASTGGAPLWAARLAQVQVSIIYIASGGSKLLDPDWRGGRVIFERFVLFGHNAVDRGVPEAVVEWLTRPAVGELLAKAAIATELLLAFGLWLPASRVFCLWWGAWFHFVIESTSRVEGFTWLTLAAYMLFVTPDVRARALVVDASNPRAVALARAVRLLDWFARFHVATRGPDCASERPSFVAVVRRDGRRETGIGALAAVAACVPLLFPLWLPLRAAACFGRRAEP
jgi:hypothetical protein